MATVHPDRGGDHELFVFLQALKEHVEECTGGSVAELHSSRHRDRRGFGFGWTGGHDGPDRIPYDAQLGYVDEFVTLTMRALSVGQHVEEPYRSILALLIDCAVTDHGRRASRQCRGASYKQLAAIGHRFGMDKAQRQRWYEVARSVPLSEQPARHILSGLQKEAAA